MLITNDNKLDGYVVGFSPNGQILLTCSKYEIKLWDIKKKLCLQTFSAYDEIVNDWDLGYQSLCLSPDGSILAIESGATLNMLGKVSGNVEIATGNLIVSQNYFVVSANGKVGIGTTSPAQPLSVHGNFLVRTTNADGNKNRMQCIVGGSSDAADLFGVSLLT